MTHILLNIKYNNKEKVLTDEKEGEKIIIRWCNFNQHTLVMQPIMHVFPSTYITKNDKNISWDIENLANDGYLDNYMYINNDVIKTYNYNGYTGIGILKESHISIHTYPEKNYMNVDFFSCRQLDKEKNTEFINNIFNKKRSTIFDVNFIDRTL
jgi:S-adenosylmethionine/arginine decarboxylase-like enzyme